MNLSEEKPKAEDRVVSMELEQVIRDRNSNRVGCIVDNGHQLVARDRFSNVVGYYHKQSDTTRDRSSNRLCQGNVLAALILKGQR
jgi:hypothetical protein